MNECVISSPNCIGDASKIPSGASLLKVLRGTKRLNSIFFSDCVSASYKSLSGNASLFLLLWLCLIVLPAKASNLELYAAGSPLPLLQEDEGYALLNLEAGGTAPSIEFFAVRSSESKYLKRDEKVFAQLFSGYELNLKDKAPGLYLFVLPEGLYQISKVNAPYFNFPFVMRTDSRRTWRFHISRERINYIGHLFIDQERHTNSIDVSLFDRLASDLGDINRQLETLLNSYVLESGRGVRDDFYQWYANSSDSVSQSVGVRGKNTTNDEGELAE